MPEPTWLELSFNISPGHSALLTTTNTHQEQKINPSAQARLCSAVQRSVRVKKSSVHLSPNTICTHGKNFPGLWEAAPLG